MKPRTLREFVFVAIVALAVPQLAQAQTLADSAETNRVVDTLSAMGQSIHSISGAFDVTIEAGFDAGRRWHVAVYRWVDGRAYLEVEGGDNTSREVFGWFQDAPASIHFAQEGRHESPTVYVFEDGGFGGANPVIAPDDVFLLNVYGEYALPERLAEGKAFLYGLPDGTSRLVSVDQASGRREEFYRTDNGQIARHVYGFIPLAVLDALENNMELAGAFDFPFAVQYDTQFEAFSETGGYLLPARATRITRQSESNPNYLAGLIQLYRLGSSDFDAFQAQLRQYFSERTQLVVAERIEMDSPSISFNGGETWASLELILPENGEFVDARSDRAVALAELLPDPDREIALPPSAETGRPSENGSERNIAVDNTGSMPVGEGSTGGGNRLWFFLLVLLVCGAGGGYTIIRLRK